MEGTMNILRGPFVPAILFLLILPVCIWAGTTGKIVGTIQDKETGESMPGVSVMIEGTMMGTSTDVDGYYYIINVPVGSHTLKASMVGYTPQKQVNVKASADLTTTVDFKLSPTVLELPEVITVTAERPMVDKSRTSTMHITTATEILGMPVSTSDGVVVNTAGVVFDRIGGPVSQAGPAATVQGAEGRRPGDSANPGVNLRGGRSKGLQRGIRQCDVRCGQYRHPGGRTGTGSRNL
jgi:hypothetical protein